MPNSSTLDLSAAVEMTGARRLTSITDPRPRGCGPFLRPNHRGSRRTFVRMSRTLREGTHDTIPCRTEHVSRGDRYTHGRRVQQSGHRDETQKLAVQLWRTGPCQNTAENYRFVPADCPVRRTRGSAGVHRLDRFLGLAACSSGSSAASIGRANNSATIPIANIPTIIRNVESYEPVES